MYSDYSWILTTDVYRLQKNGTNKLRNGYVINQKISQRQNSKKKLPSANDRLKKESLTEKQNLKKKKKKKKHSNDKVKGTN